MHQHAFLFVVACMILRSVAGSSPVHTKTSCHDGQMIVDVTGNSSNWIHHKPHLQQLKNYPDLSCHPEQISETHFRFRLDLHLFYRCGTTQILNKLTGARTFYNRVVYYAPDGTSATELVKCPSKGVNSTREKRDVLPAGFTEAENISPVKLEVGRAPEPMLSMLVKQNGAPIGHELVVKPGEPLTMEVSLDSVSNDIYGILVSKLDVTDTGAQSEDIIINGCTVDSYLFENFLTTNGDLLEARFKAFKFPDTNYVLFRATVNVCLNECKGIDCSNGQVGYGRRRRRDAKAEPEPQTPVSGKHHADFEIQTTTLLRVEAGKLRKRRATVIGSTGSGAVAVAM